MKVDVATILDKANYTALASGTLLDGVCRLRMYISAKYYKFLMIHFYHRQSVQETNQQSET